MEQIRLSAHQQLFKPEEVYATINDVTQCEYSAIDNTNGFENR